MAKTGPGQMFFFSLSQHSALSGGSLFFLVHSAQNRTTSIRTEPKGVETVQPIVGSDA